MRGKISRNELQARERERMARIADQIQSFVAKLLHEPAIITRRDITAGYFTKEAAHLHAQCQSVLDCVNGDLYNGAPANSPRCHTVSHEINPSRDLVQKARHFRVSPAGISANLAKKQTKPT